MGVGKISEAQAKKIMELQSTKMKVDIHGKTITEDSDGNVLNASLIYTDGELIVTKEYVKFLMRKSGIKEVISGYYMDKGKINEQITSDEDHYSYVITADNGMSLFRATFKIGKKGIWKTRQHLEVACIVTKDPFTNPQYNNLIALVNSMNKPLKESINKEEILTKAGVTAEAIHN